MKRKASLILPLLMLSPLLMANSPAPMVRSEEYNDFTCSYLAREEVDDLSSEGRFLYNFEVSNTGTGYIEYIYVQSDIINGNLYGYDPIFDDLVVLPGQTSVLSLRTNKDINMEGFNGTYHGRAYQQTIGDAFDNYSVEIEERISDYSSYNTYSYYVSFNTNVNIANNKYEYGLVVELTYKGKNYAMHRDLGSSKEFYLCSSDEQLDLNQLAINKLTMTKGEKYRSGLGTFLVVLFIILIVGACLLGSGVVFVIVFFSVKAARKRRRMA